MQHQIVSRDEWLAARKAHLRNEKALTRMRDLVAAERRALAWVQVEKAYFFDTPEGKKTLAELFGNNSQLVIHHFMFSPPGTPAARAARSRPTTPRARSRIWSITT